MVSYFNERRKNSRKQKKNKQIKQEKNIQHLNKLKHGMIFFLLGISILSIFFNFVLTHIELY